MIKPRDATCSEPREAVLLHGRLAIVFALGRNYLFLPFAVLSMVATVLHHKSVPGPAAIPFLLLVVSGFASNRMADAYEKTGANADAALWARRYTMISAATGAAWGLGAIVWFVPHAFPEEAYLVLAMMGMSAAEFVARAAYRPAYLAHGVASLVPLAVMLMIQGGTLQLLSSLIVLCFGAALYGFANRVAGLLDECILLRHSSAKTISTLSAEKQVAEVHRDAAQASERAKSKFVAHLSRELRTPLTAILGMAQLLERSDLDKAQRDHVRVLLESCLGLKALLGDVIALAQEDAPAVLPEESADAAQAAQTVARLLQPNAWEKRLRLSVNVAPEMPRIAADPRLVRRILLKLVANAIKFTERGHVEISLDAIANEQGRKMVRIAVTDTGPGFPQKAIASLFEPFAKADDPSAAHQPGAGVGLAVAKRLIDSVGGSIGAESELGMGATFWITIPAAEDAPHVPEREEPPETIPPHELALLVYVPNTEARAIIESWLAPFGNRVVAACSLAEASTMSIRGGFDAVIASASDADSLAAVPGQATPILALASADDRPPGGAHTVLRWPATPTMLYSALLTITGTPGAEPACESEDDKPAIDTKAFTELEKSLGFLTLIDILQSYLKTAEELTKALAAAADHEDWKEAGRLAQDIAGAAGGLGLGALTTAARALAQGARDGTAARALKAASGEVLSEHRRVHEALTRLYPDLSAAA